MISILSVAVALLLWALATETGIISRANIPSPTDLAREFVNLVENGYSGSPLWQHVAASLGRTMIGLVCAIVIGTPIGLLIGYLPAGALCVVLEPFLSIFLADADDRLRFRWSCSIFGIGEFEHLHNTTIPDHSSTLRTLEPPSPPGGGRSASIPQEFGRRVARNDGLKCKGIFSLRVSCRPRCPT